MDTKYPGLLTALALLIPASVGSAVELVNSEFIGVDLTGEGGGTSVTTSSDFTTGNASKIVVAISSEGRAAGGANANQVADSVLFGGVELIRAEAISEPQLLQRTEIWYADLTQQDTNTITVNWVGDPGAGGSGLVNGTGFSIFALNEIEAGGPVATATAGSGLSIDISVPADGDAPIDESIVISNLVANGGSFGVDLDASTPGFAELGGGNIGSAIAVAGSQIVPSADLPATISHVFTASGSRPALVSAAWEAGDFIDVPREPLPGDTNGDFIVDINDYNNIRDFLGRRDLTPGEGADLAGNDGIVNLADLQEFLANFPRDESTPAAGAAVPEPTAALLGVLALAAPLLRRVGRPRVLVTV